MQDALREAGLTGEVRELSASTRTARDAARALGCEVRQIAKSLLFRGVQTQRPLLVVASGRNRVDEQRLASLAGEPVELAHPDWVKQVTGFPVGGVPPLALAQPVATYIDADLMALTLIWAAAGTPNAVFPLTPDELARVTGGEIVPIA